MLKFSGELGRLSFSAGLIIRIGVFVVAMFSIYFAFDPRGAPVMTGFLLVSAIQVWASDLAYAIFALSLLSISIRRMRDIGISIWPVFLLLLLFAAEFQQLGHFMLDDRYQRRLLIGLEPDYRALIVVIMLALIATPGRAGQSPVGRGVSMLWPIALVLLTASGLSAGAKFISTAGGPSTASWLLQSGAIHWITLLRPLPMISAVMLAALTLIVFWNHWKDSNQSAAN